MNSLQFFKQIGTWISNFIRTDRLSLKNETLLGKMVDMDQL